MLCTTDHDDYDRGVLDLPFPCSSEPKWLLSGISCYESCGTPSPEPCMLEEYQHQQYNVACQSLRSPPFRPASHSGTSSAGFRIGGSGSKTTGNSSQDAVGLDNGNAARGSDWPAVWETEAVRWPQRVQLPAHHTGNGGIKKPSNIRCPICSETFKRRDNIKPHVRRMHPERFSILYAPACSTLPQSITVPTTHHQFANGEATNFDDPGCGKSLTNHLSLGEQLKTLGQAQCEVGCLVPQKRSLDSAFLEDTAISDGSKRRSVPSLTLSRNDSSRTLACPFQKRDPSKHQKCLTLTLNRIKDVKQHINRCHTGPEYYCARCWEGFDTAHDRDNHARQAECIACSRPEFEGITEEQSKELSEKSLRTMDLEGQWFRIWSVIFPGTAPPSSPYLGHCLEELVPVLRTKWELQRSSIVARAGEVSSQQLSRAMDCAMDMFLQSLEGEVAGHGMTNR